MQKTEVLLFVRGGDTNERIAAEAAETCEGGARVFRFREGGVEYCLRFAETASISRAGGVAYTLELDPGRATRTQIVTEYGFLSAEVKTLRAEISRKNGFSFRGEYELQFDGYSQRRKVSFYARGGGRVKR